MRAPVWGSPLPGRWASGFWRSPTPDRPPLGRAAGARYAMAVGPGGCGRGNPSPTPQHALLRAGFARCEGGTRAPLWGRLLPGCGASRVGRSPTPDRPPLGRAAGACYSLPVGAGGVGVGTRPLPHSGRSCEMAFRVAGAETGRQCGGASCMVVGRPGLGALRRPIARPWVVRPGSDNHWLSVRGLWAWGPVTDPTARFLASWLCALWGRHEGARAGGVSCLGVGRPALGASHAGPPVLGACDRGPLPTGCGCGGCGRGDPSPIPQGALLRAGFARCGGGMRAPTFSPFLCSSLLCWHCACAVHDRASVGACALIPMASCTSLCQTYCTPLPSHTTQ